MSTTKDVSFQNCTQSCIYCLPRGKCGKLGKYRYRNIKICTPAKFRKYDQMRGRALILSTLRILRKSSVFYSCTLAEVNNTDYGSGGQTDPNPSAACTPGMPQCMASDPGTRLAPFRGPSAGPRGWRRSRGSKCASWVGRPPAKRAGPCFRPRRPTRAERAAAPIFGESVSAILHTPIHLNWVQFSTETSLVLSSVPNITVPIF